MFSVLNNPGAGELYLAVTCRVCKCKLLLVQNLNNEDRSIATFVNVMCPHCEQLQRLPIEHYHHQVSGENGLSLPSRAVM